MCQHNRLSGFPRLSLRKTELVGVITILRPSKVTFRHLFPRCMIAVGGQTFYNIAAIKREDAGIFLFLCSRYYPEQKVRINPSHESRGMQTNKQTKTYKKYVIFQKELSL